MAKKWGKRGKQGGQSAGLDADPRNMFGFPQAPRNAPPASSTPLADHLRRGWPGVDAGYVVLPRSIAESMPLPWQQQMAALLAQFHDTHARLAWPTYRVVPSRPERLVDLDEEQLAEAGYLVEIDSDGEMVYRERSGRKVEDPEHTTVLVSCLDPIVRGAQQTVRQAPAPAQGRPAPMNIGPQPVWRTTSASPPSAPPLPPPPTAPSVSSPQPREPVESVEQTPVPPVEAEPVGEPAPEPPAAVAPATAAVEEPAVVPEPPSAPLAEDVAEDADVDTPPRGIAVQQPAEPSPKAVGAPQPPAAQPRSDRGWFDEMPGERSGEEPVRAEPSRAEPSGQGGEFGPTGDEPTEIPYRYRR
ncbi:hypothetical protein [Prauserella flavalba]|uniref:Uncharacterized protein n=1 Tax=Prauserella flavalba TaxID=1477506 RepID=A0A318LVA9_9PSEU|nr:hypothetical protein [Prauserella flavalba]PXY37435.1 hypothetical protein BA062_06855 [Prauserella flavalba]